MENNMNLPNNGVILGNSQQHDELQYLNLIKNIINNGKKQY